MAKALAFAALLLAIFAIGTAQEQPAFASVFEAVAQNPQIFGSLAATVGIAGNDTAQLLSDPTLQAIILAPDNEAFANTLSGFPGAASFAQPQASSLILAYHVLPSNVSNPSFNLTDGETISTFLTGAVNESFANASITTLTFRLLGDNQVYVGGLPPGGTFFLNESITAGQSRIYTLKGGLMVPPSKILTVSAPPVALTLAEAVSNNANLSSLLAIISADPVLLDFVTNPDQEVTVFAPTNQYISEFLTSANLTFDDVAGTDIARRIVLNHIVPARPYTAAQLPDGTVTVPTAASGDSLEITKSGGGVTVAGGGNMGAINVTTANVLAGKSVVHVIAGFILPDMSGPAEESSGSESSGVESSPESSPETSESEAPEYETLVAAVTALGLTSLAQAVNAAGLTATLADPTTQVTLLAPSNAAFEMAAQNPAVASQITNTTFVTYVLLYHAFPNVSTDFVDGQILPTLLAGQESMNITSDNTLTSITVRLPSTDSAYVGGLAPGAAFNLTGPITAGQSNLYVIDNVLIPPSTVLGAPETALTINTLLNNPAVSILAQLIRADPELLPLVTEPYTAVTIFAPTDAAITNLLSTLGVTAADLLGTARAQRIVRNHILIARPYTAAQVPMADASSPLQLMTAQPGDMLSVTSTGGSTPNITVAGAGNTSPISVVTPNLKAGMSVVHLIDGVILPDESTPVPPSPPPLAATPVGPDSATAVPPPPPRGAATGVRSSLVLLTTLVGAAMLVALMGM